MNILLLIFNIYLFVKTILTPVRNNKAQLFCGWSSHRENHHWHKWNTILWMDTGKNKIMKVFPGIIETTLYYHPPLCWKFLLCSFLFIWNFCHEKTNKPCNQTFCIPSVLRNFICSQKRCFPHEETPLYVCKTRCDLQAHPFITWILEKTTQKLASVHWPPFQILWLWRLFRYYSQENGPSGYYLCSLNKYQNFGLCENWWFVVWPSTINTNMSFSLEVATWIPQQISSTTPHHQHQLTYIKTTPPLSVNVGLQIKS